MKWFLAAAAAACTVAAPAVALAHTEPDLIAVPAGSEATVDVRSSRGRVRRVADRRRAHPGAPFAAARAEAGSTGGPSPRPRTWHLKTPCSSGQAVSVPADEPGAFPVGFTVPDAVGTLLAFPAVQRCA